MTVRVTLFADSVREAHPDWLIWLLGTGRWWAMNKHSALTISRETLEDLAEALKEITP
ncbi:hypothetical protein [Streptosporangium sp. NPDC002524]|uniref:hypothetical protein n=1 Tax=Streptosporangium sp. NPDC002524 TaxID=3154537 RepID=UPI0033323813